MHQTQKRTQTKNHLTITEHTAVVSSHAILNHGNASHSEKFLLQSRKNVSQSSDQKHTAVNVQKDLGTIIINK